MKFLLCLVLLCVPITVFADTMCVRDNTLVLSFGGGEKKLSSGYHVDSAVFWHDYDVGRMYGEATCLSAEESLGQTNIGAFYGVGDYANTLITADKGLKGMDADGNERNYCWCRYTHPVASAWVLNNVNDSATTCASGCFSYDYYQSCASMGRPGVRSGALRSIGLIGK